MLLKCFPRKRIFKANNDIFEMLSFLIVAIFFIIIYINKAENSSFLLLYICYVNTDKMYAYQRII